MKVIAYIQTMENGKYESVVQAAEKLRKNFKTNHQKQEREAAESLNK